MAPDYPAVSRCLAVCRNPNMRHPWNLPGSEFACGNEAARTVPRGSMAANWKIKNLTPRHKDLLPVPMLKRQAFRWVTSTSPQGDGENLFLWSI